MEPANATKMNETKDGTDNNKSSAAKNEKSVDGTAAVAAEIDKKVKSEKTNMSELSNTENVKNEAPPINEHLDELSSLEQEIAKMHNAAIDSSVQSPTNVTSVSPEGTIFPLATATGAKNVEKLAASLTGELSIASLTPEQALKETAALLETGNDVETKLNTSHPLDEVDLIAVLKGTDSSHEQAQVEIDKSKASSTSSLDMGVTIEGEGQYEIMEVVDDDNDELGNENYTKQTAVTARGKQHNVVNKSIAVGGKNKMSPEQERAVALEQIANLRPKHSRRKQDLKPTDIVNNLNDDWNDYDSGNDLTIAKSKLPKKLTRDTLKTKLNVPSANNSTSSSSNNNNNSSSSGATTTIKPRIIASTAEKTQPQLEVTGEQRLGFKRTRIVKPKVIWDPDAPESQKSYAQYASAKTPPSATESPPPSPKLTTKATPLTSARIPIVLLAKKDVTVTTTKKIRPATPKEKHTTLTPIERKPSPVKPLADSPGGSSYKQDASKRRSETPSLNGSASAGKKKKVSSEIDRLMGDEGAANMIQAVEHKRRAFAVQVSSEQKKAELQKPIMRKRAFTICEKPDKLEASLTPAKKETIPKLKRAAVAKPRAADTWDYVYQQQASDDAMIIRRRSNSSYSSTASLRRLSIDKANISDTESTPQLCSKTTSTATTSAGTMDEAFTFAKPVNKATVTSNKMAGKRPNSPTTIAANTIAVDMKRAIRGSSITRSTIEKANTKESNGTFEINVRKLDKLAQIVVNTQRSKVAHTYNVQLLNKLTETLGKLAKNNEYNTVLLNGTGAHFCQGVELLELCGGSLEKRKNYATQLAAAVKTYLKTLVTFPKPLVVCINGNLKNLGVMQLPLFDFVVSSDKCTFETPYVKLGQTPEALCLWHEARVSNSVKRRLFLLGEKLTLTEIGGTTGLINKSAPPSKVLDEALTIAKRISETTADNYYSCVKRHTITKLLEATAPLDDELKIITEQWTSVKFCDNFKNN